jgi:hypothetical protein|tara:strand:+ start:410 stop:760 length:351 start_codon:yes stop_codon:yes gene_type:complete
MDTEIKSNLLIHLKENGLPFVYKNQECNHCSKVLYPEDNDIQEVDSNEYVRVTFGKNLDKYYHEECANSYGGYVSKRTGEYHHTFLETAIIQELVRACYEIGIDKETLINEINKIK